MIPIRPANAADYDAFARMYPQLNTPDPTPSRERWERELAPRTIVAGDGDVVGYCYAQVLRDTGYVRHLVSDASARRSGVGRALMQAMLERFRAAGCTRFCLNVKPDNEPALSLYRGFGMKVAYASTAMGLPWSAVERLPPGQGRPGLDDAAAEARFALPAGQIADARSMPGRVVVTLFEEGVVGLAIFDTNFPGAFPFRVADPSRVRPLLEAMFPHRRPTDARVNVVIDDGPEVEARILEVGGEVRLRTLHLEGPL